MSGYPKSFGPPISRPRSVYLVTSLLVSSCRLSRTSFNSLSHFAQDSPVRVADEAHDVDSEAVLDVLRPQGVSIHANNADEVWDCANDLLVGILLAAIHQRGVQVLILEGKDHVASLAADRLADLALLAPQCSQTNSALSIASIGDKAMNVDDLSCVEETTTGIGAKLRACQCSLLTRFNGLDIEAAYNRIHDARLLLLCLVDGSADVPRQRG